jgi:hypothetical protein
VQVSNISMVLAHKLALKNPLKCLELFLSFFTKLLHCLNVKKNPAIYGASQFGPMPSTIEPIEAHIAMDICQCKSFHKDTIFFT